MARNWLSLLLLLTFLLILPATLRGAEQWDAPSPTAAIIDKASVSLAHLPTDQIIVKFDDQPGIAGESGLGQDQLLKRLSDAAGIPLRFHRPMSGGAVVLKLPAPLSLPEVEAASAVLSAFPEVEYAEADRIMQAIGRSAVTEVAAETTPNDSLFSDQWHYTYTANTDEGINLLPAWDITTGISTTVVAVIDTGILDHADLDGKVLDGYDFISNAAIANDGDGRDPDPSDPGDWVANGECDGSNPSLNSSWHGTHVAGTIAAATNNSLGIAGVNWQAKILPVRVLGKCGGMLSDIVDGSRWAAGLSISGVPDNPNPADVLNLSLGGPGSCEFSMQAAIDDIVLAGTTVVVAAGNSNADVIYFSPGSCDDIIAVASNDRAGDKAWYSNYGDGIDVAAPGGETGSVESDGVLSTLNTGTQAPVADTYAYYQGTSMAAPHVAGVASLIIGLQPAYTPDQVLARLKTTARPFPGGSSCIDKCGAGIVDAFQALNNLAPFNQNQYLPVVFLGEEGDGNAGPTLVNGDFEQGPTGWTEYSKNNWDLILQSADLLDGVSPHSGDWAAWLGGDYDEISFVAQDVTVPGGSPYLTYWHWIGSNDYCGYDFAGVVIGGSTVVDVYDLCADLNTGGWVKHVVNLSAYANQSVSMQIRVETDSVLNSNLFVDDVSFQASADIAENQTGNSGIPGATNSRTELFGERGERSGGEGILKQAADERSR